MASDGADMGGPGAGIPGTTAGPGDAGAGPAQPGPAAAGEPVDDGASKAEAKGQDKTGSEPSIYTDALALTVAEKQRTSELAAANIASLHLENKRCYLPEIDSVEDVLAAWAIHDGTPKTELILRSTHISFVCHYVYSSDGKLTARLNIPVEALHSCSSISI